MYRPQQASINSLSIPSHGAGGLRRPRAETTTEKETQKKKRKVDAKKTRKDTRKSTEKSTKKENDSAGDKEVQDGERRESYKREYTPPLAKGEVQRVKRSHDSGQPFKGWIRIQK